MRYVMWQNGDGIWFKCSCMKKPRLLGGKTKVFTMLELKELVDAHGNH